MIYLIETTDCQDNTGVMGYVTSEDDAKLFCKQEKKAAKICKSCGSKEYSYSWRDIKEINLNENSS